MFQRDFIRNYLWKKSRLGRSHFKRLLRKGLSDIQIVELCPGLRMRLDLSRSNQEFMFWFYEEVEAPLQWAIKKLLPVGGVMVDCGANTGLMGLLAIHYRAAAAMFIEPLPRLVETIRENIRLNGFESHALVMDFAASDCDGEAEFYINEKNDGGHSLHHTSAVRCTVRTKRLAEVLDEHGAGRVDFLKIDTEGNDYRTLLGLGDYLTPDRIPLIYLEMAGEEVCSLMLQKGYRAFASEGISVNALWKKRQKELDGIAVAYFHPHEGFAGGDMLWCGKDSAYARYLARLSYLAVNPVKGG